MRTDINETPLESWKEIAAHLQRDVTTVRRWEKTQGLPVHRHLHEARSSVYAYRSELDVWWSSRTPAEKAQPAALPRKTPIGRLSAVAAIVALAVVIPGDVSHRAVAAAGDEQGLTARQLWAGQEVDTTGEVMPGGAAISYVDWDTGDLAIRDLKTGQSRHLTGKGTWVTSDEFALFSTISPDGSRVAYSWFNADQSWDLRVTSTRDGGVATQPQVLAHMTDSSYIQPYAWAPDGKSVLALISRVDKVNQLALVPLSGAAPRVVKTLDWRYPVRSTFSRDGAFIAYDIQPNPALAQRDIFLVAADGSRETALVQHGANDLMPIFTPDGSAVVFLSDRAGTMGLWSIPVANGKPAGTPRLLKHDIGRVVTMGLDATGSLFYALETGMRDVYVASMDVAGGILLEEPQPLSQAFVGSNRGADWSPDGSRVAYLSQRGDYDPMRRPSIVIRDVKNGTERVLATNPPLTDLSRPRWSPDGRRLAVYAYGVDWQRGVYAIDAQTGRTSLLFPLAPASYAPQPVWSKDGNAIFYTYPGDGDFLFRMHDLRTGADRVLFRPGNAHNTAPSPDGTSVAFTYPSSSEDKTESRLAVLALDGGEPREVVTIRDPLGFTLDSVAWTSDGKHLLYGRRDKSGTNTFYRVPASGGPSVKLPLTTQGVNAGLRLHPDGRRIAFTSGTRSAEFWVLENLMAGAR